MRSNICNFFRNGHCKMKLSCNKSHDILTCRFGPFCPVLETCHFRHPPLCVKFLYSKCGYYQNDQFIVSKNCSKFHNPTYLPPPPLAPPPLAPHHPPWPTPIRRLHSLETQIQRITADLAAMATEVTENKNKSTKATGLEEQAKLDAKQKPDMQNILTVSDDNNDEIETLELSQQKKSWWSPWLKTQPSPTSLATPGGQEGTLVPPAHHTPSDHSANLKQLEVDIMDLQQNLSSLEVNFKNQKSIIDALSDNHIRCNEIKQELETNITQRFDSLDMDKQFTDLDRKIEQNTQKISNLNKVDDAQFTLYLNKVDNAQESVANLETRMQTRLQDIEENFGNLATATKTLQTQSRQAKIKLEQNIQQEMQTAEGDRHKIKQKVTEINNKTSKIKEHHDNFEVILRKLSKKSGESCFSSTKYLTLNMCWKMVAIYIHYRIS